MSAEVASERPRPSAIWTWNGPGLAITTGFVVMTLFATTWLLASSVRFHQVFRELGVQLPALTLLVIAPGFHATAAAALLVPLALRHRVGWTAWATAVWICGLLAYLALSHAGLFGPILQLISNLGQQQVE